MTRHTNKRLLQYDFKNRSYFTGLNENLFKAIPTNAKRILDVGCGEGNLGAALKRADPTRTVCGIEVASSPATAAKERLDSVFVQDIETSSPPIPEGSLDCIIYPDILEHLIDPVAEDAQFLALMLWDARQQSAPDNLAHKRFRQIVDKHHQRRDKFLGQPPLAVGRDRRAI